MNRNDLINQIVYRNKKGHYCLKLDNTKLTSYKTCPPKKGEYYLKPIGIKNTWVISVACQDHTKRNYIIINP